MQNFSPLLAAMAILAVSGAQAQGVYRCGDSYSQQPCAGGKLVQAEDTRTPSQKAQADAVTIRDAKSAAVLEQDRLKQENSKVSTYIPPPKMESPSVESPEKPVLNRPKKPAYFTAIAPAKAGGKPVKKKTPNKKPKKA